MNFLDSTPKGMKIILEERGVDTRNMTADKMREVLRSHCDFKNEKSRVEMYLSENCGHIVYMLPKYHCEFNPFERVLAQAMRYTKAYYNYHIQSLQNKIVPALESVSHESIKKHFRKVRH